MSFPLPFAIRTLNPALPLVWNGPYSGATETLAIQAANAAIPLGVRIKGLDVILIINNVTRRYWYKDGVADTDLVEFSSGLVAETDPTVPSHVKAITTTDITNWNTAHSWGNHNGLYLPASYTPTWLQIQNKPTTLAGFGITDAVPITRTVNDQPLSANVAIGLESVLEVNSNGGGYSISNLGNVQVSELYAGGNIYANFSQIVATRSWVQSNYILTTEKGAALGVVPLNAFSKIDTAYLPDFILGNVRYQGLWNAATNTPTLGAASASNRGHYYIVSAAGTQFGKDFEVGDWAISSGTSWDKVDNSDALTSFNGRTGNITLLSSDVTTALGYIPSQTGHTHVWSEILNRPTALSQFVNDVNYDSRYYTIGQINNFFAGTALINGYNKSNWDSAYSFIINYATPNIEQVLDAGWDAQQKSLENLNNLFSSNIYTSYFELYSNFVTTIHNGVTNSYEFPVPSNNYGVLALMENLPTALSQLTNDINYDGFYYRKAEINNFFSGTSPITGYNNTNWNTAFSWGNHAGLYRPNNWVPTWNEVTGKPVFATVATTGSYNDLLNLPNLGIYYLATNPANYISRAGISHVEGIAGYNNVTGVISIPRNTSHLTNDSGFTVNGHPLENQRLSTTNTVIFRDVHADRGNGTGVIFFGGNQRYLFWDGFNYVVNTASGERVLFHQGNRRDDAADDARFHPLENQRLSTWAHPFFNSITTANNTWIGDPVKWRTHITSTGIMSIAPDFGAGLDFGNEFALVPNDQIYWRGNPIWHNGNRRSNAADDARFQFVLSNQEGIELNMFGNGDRNAYLDFHSHGALGVLDFSARVIRRPGINGNLEIVNVGSGNFTYNGNLIWHNGNLIQPLVQSRPRYHIDDSTSINDGLLGHSFNYATGAGVFGPVLTFGALGQGGYRAQFNIDYGVGDTFLFRTINDDFVPGIWNPWRIVYHSGNHRSDSANDSRYVLKWESWSGTLVLRDATTGGAPNQGRLQLGESINRVVTGGSDYLGIQIRNSNRWINLDDAGNFLYYDGVDNRNIWHSGNLRSNADNDVLFFRPRPSISGATSFDNFEFENGTRGVIASSYAASVISAYDFGSLISFTNPNSSVQFYMPHADSQMYFRTSYNSNNWMNWSRVWNDRNFNPNDYYTKGQADSRFKPMNYFPTWTEVSGRPTHLSQFVNNLGLGPLAYTPTVLDGDSNMFLNGEGNWDLVHYGSLAGAPDINNIMYLTGSQTVSGFKTFLNGRLIIRSNNASSIQIDYLGATDTYSRVAFPAVPDTEIYNVAYTEFTNAAYQFKENQRLSTTNNVIFNRLRVENETVIGFLSARPHQLLSGVDGHFYITPRNQITSNYEDFNSLCLEYNGNLRWRTNVVYHTGNLRDNSANDARYVLKAGDVMTGTLKVAMVTEMYNTANNWAYNRYTSGSNFWDIGYNSSSNYLEFRFAGQDARMGIRHNGEVYSKGDAAAFAFFDRQGGMAETRSYVWYGQSNHAFFFTPNAGNTVSVNYDSGVWNFLTNAAIQGSQVLHTGIRRTDTQDDARFHPIENQRLNNFNTVSFVRLNAGTNSTFHGNVTFQVTGNTGARVEVSSMSGHAFVKDGILFETINRNNNTIHNSLSLYSGGDFDLYSRGFSTPAISLQGGIGQFGAFTRFITNYAATLADSSYEFAPIQLRQTLADFNAGARIGLGFHQQGIYGGYFYMNGPNEWRYRNHAGADNEFLHTGNRRTNAQDDTRFSFATRQDLNLVGLDVNLFYPVMITIPVDRLTRMRIRNSLGSGVIPSWATHPGGFTLNLDWHSIGNGWGTTTVNRQVFQYHEQFTSQLICGGIDQSFTDSREIVYLRGGAIYRFECDIVDPQIVIVSTSFTAPNGAVIAPLSTPFGPVWHSPAHNDFRFNIVFSGKIGYGPEEFVAGNGLVMPQSGIFSRSGFPFYVNGQNGLVLNVNSQMRANYTNTTKHDFYTYASMGASETTGTQLVFQIKAGANVTVSSIHNGNPAQFITEAQDIYSLSTSLIRGSVSTASYYFENATGTARIQGRKTTLGDFLGQYIGAGIFIDNEAYVSPTATYAPININGSTNIKGSIRTEWDNPPSMLGPRWFLGFDTTYACSGHPLASFLLDLDNGSTTADVVIAVNAINDFLRTLPNIRNDKKIQVIINNTPYDIPTVSDGWC